MDRVVLGEAGRQEAQDRLGIQASRGAGVITLEDADEGFGHERMASARPPQPARPGQSTSIWQYRLERFANG